MVTENSPYTLNSHDMSDKKNIKKEFRAFNALSLRVLYEMIRLRVDVFVVEQDCPYSDLDNKDQDAIHYSYTLDSGRVIGYLRILNKGVSYNEVSIGRVIIDPEFRKLNLGNDLMAEAMSYIKNEMGENAVRISAQKHLENYYSYHGFKSVGEPYLEDGIPHIQMVFNG